VVAQAEDNAAAAIIIKKERIESNYRLNRSSRTDLSSACRVGDREGMPGEESGRKAEVIERLCSN
jgi:hypothetical protein